MNKMGSLKKLGFKVLQLPYSDDSLSAHHLFIKEHSVRVQSSRKPEGRTLFVLNVPPYATEDAIKTTFSKAGKVQNVIFSSKPTTQDEKNDHDDDINEKIIKTDPSLNKYFKSSPPCGFNVAYVIFEKPAHLIKALNLTELSPLSKNKNLLTGIKKWMHNYNSSIPDEAELEEHINKYMKLYDEIEQQRKDEEKNGGEPDEDGWVTVTKRGRKPGVARKESVTNRIRKREHAKKKKKQLLNFYTFQIRESKMKHLADLRKKFEQDKKKIETLKQSRRFNPF